jgi:hypothetical protein
MTFAKFFLLVLFIYLVYYGFLFLLEKFKTERQSLPVTSKKVDFIVEQPKAVSISEEQVSIETDAAEKKNQGIEKATKVPGNKEETNILDDLGIEAYYSSSVDVTKDNLLTLTHEEP